MNEPSMNPEKKELPVKLLRPQRLRLFLYFLFVTYSGFGQTKDYRFQSLYVFTFAKSIEWPSNAFTDSDFVIAIYDNNRVYQEFKENMNNKSVNGKKVAVKHYQTITEIEPSPILFLPAGNKNVMKQITQKLAQSPCLLVTEKEGLIKEGSIINLVVTDEGKMKYELNATAAAQRNIKIPSTIKSIAITSH